MKKLLWTLLIVSTSILHGSRQEQLNKKLCNATLENLPEAMLTALTQGANVNCECSHTTAGFTPLTAAVGMGHWQATELLLSYGANIHKTYTDQKMVQTCVMLSRDDRKKILEALVQKKAPLDHDKDITSLNYAFFLCRPELVTVLHKAGAHTGKVPNVYLPNCASKQEFRETQVLANQEEEKYNAKLCDAASHNDTQAMSNLLDQGTNINCDCNDTMGFTPLAVAATHRHVQATEFLLSKHANPRLFEANCESIVQKTVRLCPHDTTPQQREDRKKILEALVQETGAQYLSSTLEYSLQHCRPDLAAVLHKGGAILFGTKDINRNECFSEQDFQKAQELMKDYQGCIIIENTK